MPAISIMIKPASGRCNLRCKYCFYHDLTKNREIADYGIMDIDTAKRIIDSAVDFAKGDNIYFTFQGGEPLLAGKEYFLRFFEHARQKIKTEIYSVLNQLKISMHLWHLLLML